MKKRLLYIVLAAVFAAALVLTAAAAVPAPGDGPAETETSAPMPDPTDAPSDGTAAEIPDGPDDEPGDEPGDKTPDDPADETPDEPTEKPVDGPAEEPTDAAALDEPMPINEDSDVPYVDANGGALTCPSATVVEEETAEWAAGWYVARGTVTISQRVNVTGEVHLILADGCDLTAGQGIQVSEGNSLTIWGQKGGTGRLYANGAGDPGGWSAGIGGRANDDVGSITINGGVITAIGGPANAGIGSAIDFESITINGGNVTASGHVGIGTKRVDDITGGPIKITGGTVTATGGGENDTCSEGIGGRVRSVTITGGDITATGGGRSAGIGVRDCDGTIEISGGTVNATGGAGYGPGNGGAGISSYNAGAITVSGGTVTATGGKGAENSSGGAGIGSTGGQITVSGGNVTANGGTSGRGSDYYGIDGSFSTGPDGNGLIYSNEIKESNREGWSGVVFEGDGNTGQVYGSPAPAESFAVQKGQTLTVPEGTTLTVGDGVTLTNDGTIENNGSIVKNGTITGDGRISGTPVEGYKLTVTPPAFETVKYGYDRPDAKAITITNTGTAVEHISAVELTSGAEWFELEGSFTGELPKGGSNTSWTIRPKAGLSADGGWTYEATVSVTYDFGHMVTAKVSFTVELADGTGTVTMADYTCGDTSVKPEIYSSTNAGWDDTYGVKGTGEYNFIWPPAVAGEYTVRIVFDDNPHYSSFALTADFRVTHKFDADWEQREDGSHRTCAGCGTELLLTTESLTDVPAGLESKYGSVQALTQALAQAVDTGENYAVCDVVLKAREAGIEEWHEAAPADFPAEGITVTLPYPEGTDEGYTFTAVHMFAAGERAGQTEKPAVKNDADGVTFTVTGLSPVCIGWKAPAAAPGATSSPAAAAPYTGDESPLLFWTAALCLAGAALGALLLRRRRG